MNLTKNRSELIREAADKLNIVGTGQSLEADYEDRLDRNVDPLLLQLAADGICSVTNDAFIPSEWFDPLAGLLANVCAPVAGKNFDPRIKDYYEILLRRATSGGPTYAVLEGEYF